MSDLEIVAESTITPSGDEMNTDDENLIASEISSEEEEGSESSLRISDVGEDDEKAVPEIPPSPENGFTVDENDYIPDEDIRQMLFLFCVNEDIPLHYKQLLGKIIKKETYKKSDKLFIFNMIGYVWQKAKEAKDEKDQLTKIQKIIIVRRIHKIVFGTFDDY